MKSFVTYPSAFQKFVFPQATHLNPAGNVIPQCELFKKVKALDGCIVKCGITAAEAFSRFSTFRKMEPAFKGHRMIAFEKTNISLSPDQLPMQRKISVNSVAVDDVQLAMKLKAEREKIDYLPGNVDDTIPDYLIENPELKISYLELDLDDYEATITTLEYLFPRIIESGVLVSNNYFKKGAETKAIDDYFASSRIKISSYSVNKGPHYVVLS